MSFARKHRSVSGLLLGACLLCPSAVRGQSGPSLQGTVLDRTGGIIPGADVILFSDDWVLTTKANENGIFRFASVPPHIRYVEASSPGFFSRSIAMTEQNPERLSFTLWVGEGNMPARTECSPPDNMLPPAVSYEERSYNVQLTGTVTDLSRVPLAFAIITLLRVDLDAPLAERDRPRGLAMKDRFLKERPVAEVSSNDKGEFQFSDLESGWYRLKAEQEGYSKATVNFWVARETLTRLSRIYLFSVPPKCG
jgi:hypothetical protein